MACKVIVNRDSGNSSRLDMEKLLRSLGCVDAEVETIDSASNWSADGYDTVIVCGGDGTLHNAIERCSDKKIIYAPCGTLNETSRTEKVVRTVGKVNGQLFSYVCATGSFTEIGYTAKTKAKQVFRGLAYLPEVFKHYKSHQIRATIDVDGKLLEGEYTLLMILKSHRCFGFNFNKSYRKKRGLYLLAVKSCGKDNLVNRAKMFFPFFRIFFCGVQAPCQTKHFALLPFDNLTIDLHEAQDFCVDGEKRTLDGRLQFCEQTLDNEIRIIKTPFCRRKKTF